MRYAHLYNSRAPQRPRHAASDYAPGDLTNLMNGNEADTVRGAVFTRREVVEFILDLCDYSDDRPLHQCRLLEPSFGEGDFLLVAVERLLSSCTPRKLLVGPGVVQLLKDAIRAVEIHHASFLKTRTSVVRLLGRHGIRADDAGALL